MNRTIATAAHIFQATPMLSAAEVIESLSLEPLPAEGGYFRRIFTHPQEGSDAKPLLTGIYYLITHSGFSALHRLQSVETFHFHAGDSVQMLQLSQHAPCGWQRLGLNLKQGERPFLAVPAGAWQGTRLLPGAKHGWALLSVMVCPGFRWEDFELGERAALSREFPDWSDAITTLTR